MAVRTIIPINEKPEYYTFVWTSVLALVLLSFFLAFTSFGIPVWNAFTLRYGVMLFMLSFTYFATSWKELDESEIGGIFVLNHPTKEVGRGWHLVPRGICRLAKMPLSVEEIQFPADPEQVFKGIDELPLPVAMLRPIRSVTGPPSDTEGDQVLNVQTSIEVSLFIRWRILKMSFFEFWINTPGIGWSGKKLEIIRQMRDAAEEELDEEIAKQPLSGIVGKLEQFNAGLYDAVVGEMEGWGVYIDECRMLSPDLSHELNQALLKIPEARALKVEAITRAEGEKATTILAAEGEKAAEILRSEGEAQARINVLKAEGEGLKAAADASGIDVAVIRAGNIAKETIGEGDLVLGLDGVSQIMGLAKAVMKGVSK